MFPALPTGAHCAVPRGSAGRSRVRALMMVATVISNVLSVKSGTLSLGSGEGRERLAHVLVSEVTRPPAGWVEFCARQPGECAGATTAPRNLTLSTEAWKELVRVNKWVKETIKPLTDLEHWGVVERWSYPDDGYGDCEDYVLLKRRMLIPPAGRARRCS